MQPLSISGKSSSAAAAAECCDDFETCVSCCMRPDQKEALLRVLDTTRGHRLRAILSARDQVRRGVLGTPG